MAKLVSASPEAKGSARHGFFVLPSCSLPLAFLTHGMPLLGKHSHYLTRFTSRLTQRARSALAGFKRGKSLLILIFAVGLLYSSLSILRHWHFTSGAYDLAIFDQVVWQYSRFHTPLSSVRSNLLRENILGDHFHPILALLAPLYWLIGGVEALLIAQALLFAIAIVPIFLFTKKRLGKTPAYLFSIAYAIFWGVQKAVDFDFHEIAFAVPLVALAIYFIDEQNWKAYFACLFLLLMTKENLAVTVVFFGVYLLVIRQFKHGLVSIAAGTVWFFAAVKVVIPFFQAPGRASGVGSYYRYWSYNQFGPDPFSALWAMIKSPLFVIRTLVSPAVKLRTYWYIFHPFLFLPFFSPLFILALPLIAERFLSEGSQFWITDYHYTAMLAPVLAMASADSLFRITRLFKEKHAGRLALSASVLILVLNAYLLPGLPLWKLRHPAFWRFGASENIGHKSVSLIPREASVSAQGPIAPHLSQRPAIFVLNPLTPIPDADFIITSERVSSFPFPSFQEIEYYLNYQQARGYRRIFDEDGWVILKREAISGNPVPVFNDAAFVEQTVPDSMAAGQSYQAQVILKNTGVYAWTASSHYRLALLSTTHDWGLTRVELPGTVEAGASVTFTFTVRAPNKPGSYLFRWGMVQEGVVFFGESSPEALITVTVAPDPE